MANILSFFDRRRPAPAPVSSDAALAAFLNGFSIEVMPRTAEKVASFRDLLPAGTRVYIAHIDGTPIADMVATAKRLTDEGFPAMPHLPARSIADRTTLAEWLSAYADAGVTQALLLGGGRPTPVGAFDNSMQLMETGLFDAKGFTRLHVAGHPEGNKDIAPDGSDRAMIDATRWKQAFAERTGAAMALVTQFVFAAEPVIAWTDRLRAENIGLPVHIGVAGPAKLQTLVKFALSCGVGPSLAVLQKRAADLSKLVLPFTPEDLLRALAAHKAAHPAFPVEAVHFFPLGGIGKTAEFCDEFGRPAGAAAARRA
jgi:methylenetetrahydrofolate reductase (NADPH)